MKPPTRFWSITMLVGISFIMLACSAKTRLEEAVKDANHECPIEVDETTTCLRIFTEGNSVVYYCEVQENYEFSVERLKAHSSIFKSRLLQEIRAATDPDEKALLDMLKQADYNLVYRFVGSKSETEMDIVITPDEIP